MGKLYVLLALSFASTLLISSEAEQSGSQAAGALCPGGLLGCQSQCGRASDGGGGVGDVGSIINQSMFDQMLKHRNEALCPARNFYTYDAFISAANAFGGFGTTGDLDTRKREIAAFLAQTSHATTAGWADAPDGPYAWGYCFNEDLNKRGDFCVHSLLWPCVPGKQYYGRGPMQISFNYKYGPAGQAIGVDLLSNPDLVATDPVISFKTALWFWMTPQPLKPSCHDAITGGWTPSAADQDAGRVPGYGVVTNIINGELECGHGTNNKGEDRIGFYRTYCDILGLSPGADLDCYRQAPFGWEAMPSDVKDS